MPSVKFKRGDIVRNRWAGDKNPIRYFIVWKIHGGKVTTIELVNNNLRFDGSHYTNVYEEHHDSGEPAFVKVGETSGLEVMKEDLEDVFKEEL